MEAIKPGPMIGGLKWLLDIVWYLLWAVLTVSAVGFLGATLVFGFQLFGWIPESAASSLRSVVDLVVLLPLALAEILALLVIVHRLRLIVRTLMAGDPFVPENAAFFDYRIGGVELSRFDLNLGSWFAVAALLVLSQVLREGARMRQEQKLTI